MAAPKAEGADAGRDLNRKWSFLTIEGDPAATGHKPPTTYLETLCHLIKGYIGTGIFAFGGAFKNSGLILGPILFIIIALMNLDCQHMLIRASMRIRELDQRDVKPSFAETVRYTFSLHPGWLGRHSKGFGIMTNVFLYCTELGFCCVYFVFIASHMVEIAHAHGWKEANDYMMLAIILLPMWATTFLGNFRLLTPLSLGANIMMWTGIVIIFYVTLESPGPLHERKLVAGYEKLPLFFGTALYAFEGITFVIPLRNEMKNPQYFVSCFGVLNVGIAFVTLLCGATGFVSYWKYGEEITGSVFLNFPQQGALYEATKIIVSIGVLFTFTLHMYIPFEVSYPVFHKKYGPFKHPTAVRAVYRSVPVLITYTLANVVPFLALFISLVGASTAATLAMILPPILELIAFKGELRVITIVKNVFIVCVGFLGAITGTILCIYEIVQKFRDIYGKK